MITTTTTPTPDTLTRPALAQAIANEINRLNAQANSHGQVLITSTHCDRKVTALADFASSVGLSDMVHTYSKEEREREPAHARARRINATIL